MKRAFIAVEGPHDIELIGALLRSLAPKRQRIRRLDDLDPFWRPLVPQRFPHEGDLARRVPVPVFFRTATHSIAVRSDRGDSGLVDSIGGALDALDEPPDIIGLVMDADELDAAIRWQRFRAASADQVFVSWLPDMADAVVPGSQTWGVFVLPNGVDPGTLEDLLLDAGAVVYPNLLARARAYIDGARPIAAGLPRDDRRPFQKPAGERKALVACIGAVLRPGKAIQASIQDNRWLRHPDALALPRIAAARAWLGALLELPVPEVSR